MGSYHIGDDLSSDEKPVALTQVDISDVERIERMLADVARDKSKVDSMPLKVDARHARTVFELVRGASVPEASTAAGLARRSVENLNGSDAVRSVMRDYAAVRLRRAIEAGTALARETLGDAYATLAEAAREGNTTAAKEIMRLAGVESSITKKKESITTTSITAPDYQAPKEQVREETPPLTPPPLFLNTIRPQWTATLGQAEVDRAVEEEKDA